MVKNHNLVQQSRFRDEKTEAWGAHTNYSISLIVRILDIFPQQGPVNSTVERYEQTGIRLNIQKMGQIEFEILIAGNQNLITIFVVINSREYLF